jgi:GNAT superfamily N-acetyltransferase
MRRPASRRFSIVDVTAANLSAHPQAVCFINPKHEHYRLKIGWLKKRFQEGLKIKLLYVSGEDRPAGFLEYVPGEFAWRAVEAAGYLFIHCLWVYSREHRGKGLASALLEDVFREAKNLGKAGLAVVASEGPFMASPAVFLKNGFAQVDASGGYRLLVKTAGRASRALHPKFADWKSRLASCKGWHIVYSKQCPWVARFVEEVKSAAARLGVRPMIHEIKSAAEAQRAPSVYAVFNLIRDGRLLADHYISMTRFGNILKNEYSGRAGASSPPART